jgi:YVTN family beta-propeller protein
MVAMSVVGSRQLPRPQLVLAAAFSVLVASIATLTPVFEPAAAAAAATYAVSGTIPVGNENGGGTIAIASSTHRAYVASYDGNSVAVINTSTETVLSSIMVGRGPVGMAVDTIPTQLVKGLDTNPLAEHGSITPPTLPTVPTLFVANYGDDTVSVINGTTNAVTATIPLGDNTPRDLAVDPSSHTVYAAGQVASTTGQGVVTIVNGAHNTVTSSVTEPGIFSNVAVDPGTHAALVTGCCLNKLALLASATATHFTDLSVPGTRGVAVNPTTHMAYVTNANDIAGAVSVIDESTNTITATVPVGSQPYGVAVDASTDVIYVTNADDDTISVIDGTTNAVVATVPVGHLPTGIAVDGATHTAYVVNAESNTVSVISRTVTDPVKRLSGSDRFGTAVAVSTQEFPTGGAGAVVLARGDDYPDALVGVPLAVAKNAPLLLSVGTSLPAATKTEIQRVLAPGGTVYLLGGTVAIPTSVETSLTGLGYQVTRYSGSDRFATAVKVADALGAPATVLLATGTNFPDALTAGVAAAKAAGVVLLTNGTSLPSETSSYLLAHPGTVYAIGGPAATADPSATAIAGSDRFATAVAVATKFFTAPTAVGVATGLSYPDALSGGALLGHVGAPLILVATDQVPSSANTYLIGVRSTVSTGYLFGGPNTVNAATATAIGTALGG